MQYACVEIYIHNHIGIRQQEAGSILHFERRLIFGRICIVAVEAGGGKGGEARIHSKVRSPEAIFSQILLFYKQMSSHMRCILSSIFRILKFGPL